MFYIITFCRKSLTQTLYMICILYGKYQQLYNENNTNVSNIKHNANVNNSNIHIKTDNYIKKLIYCKMMFDHVSYLWVIQCEIKQKLNQPTNINDRQKIHCTSIEYHYCHCYCFCCAFVVITIAITINVIIIDIIVIILQLLSYALK